MSESQEKKSPFETLADVEHGVAVLNKVLHHKDELTADKFSTYFEKLHMHAAFSGVDRLADLAERIWTCLDGAKGETTLTAETRKEIAKLLVTYKFLINRHAQGQEETASSAA